MHELDRAQRFTAELHSKSKEAKKVKLKLAAHEQHDKEEFEQIVKSLLLETPLKDVELEIELVSYKYKCNVCGLEDEVPFKPIRCSECSSPDIEVAPDFEIIEIE